MPVGIPFQAFAKGNGLSFCLDKVDVSGYDYWTTLGGFNKSTGGVPTQQQIDDSLQNAAKLYWLLFKVNTSYEVGGSGVLNSFIDFTDDISNEHELVFFGSTYNADMAEPKERSCDPERLVDTDFFEYTDWIRGIPYYIGSGFIGIASSFYNLRIGGFPCIVRMYDGDETDENNFVGFGIYSNSRATLGDSGFLDIQGSGISTRRIGPPDGTVWLISYANLAGAGAGEDEDMAYVNLPISGVPDTIPVLCCAYAVGTNPSADAASMKSSELGGFDPEYVQIDSIELYTF